MAVMRYFDKADYALPDCAEMSYEGTRVERLTKVTIVLWNKGTDALRGEDIVSSDPIRLSIGEGGRYLNVEIEQTSDESNCCVADVRPKGMHEVILGYSYLNPGEGMRVTVLHDGVNAEPNVLGRAKGLAAGPESWGVEEFGAEVALTRKINRQGVALRWVVSMVLLSCVAVVVFVALGALGPVLPEALTGPRTIVVATAAVSSGVMGWLMCWLLSAAVSGGGMRQRFPKALK